MRTFFVAWCCINFQFVLGTKCSWVTTHGMFHICSWLVTEKRRRYNLSDVERLELEQLFHQISPESYSRIIREFRSALLREPSPTDLPHIMRAIVCRIIDEQRSTANDDLMTSLSRWLSQSMTSLRSRLVETTPLVVGNDDNMELSANVVSSVELGGFSDTDVWTALLHHAQGHNVTWCLGANILKCATLTPQNFF